MAALLFCGQVTFFLLFVYSFPTNPVKPCYRCEAPNSQCTPVMYEVSLDVPMVGDNSCCVRVYWSSTGAQLLSSSIAWRWIFEEYWSNIYLIRLNYMQIIIIVINIFIIVVVVMGCCCYDYQERIRGWSLMFHSRSLLLILTWFSNAVTFRTSISMPLQIWSRTRRAIEMKKKKGLAFLCIHCFH